MLALVVSTPVWAETPDGEVRLSLQRYEELVAKAKKGGGPEASWGRGAVSVTLPAAGEVLATVTVSSQVRLLGEGAGMVPLLPADVVLESATLGGSEVTLVRQGGMYAAWLAASDGAQPIGLTYRVPIGLSSGGERAVVVPLPPVTSSELSISGAPGGEIQIWPAAPLEGAGDTRQTRLPATSAVAIQYGGGGGARVLRADYKVVPDSAGEGMTVQVSYEVHLAGQSAWIRLAPSTAALVDAKQGGRVPLMRVAEEWLEARVEGNGKQVVEATYRLAIDRSAGQPQIELDLARAPITRIEALIPGERSVTFDPPVPLTSALEGKGEETVTRTVAHLPPTEQVVLRWTEKRAEQERETRVNARTYQLLKLDEGGLSSTVHVRYEVIRGKVKELPIELPASLELSRAKGDGIDGWEVYRQTEDNPRHVVVTLAREVESTYALELELVGRLNTQDPQPFAIPLVRPMKTFQQSGAVALIDGDKVSFAPIELASGSSFIKTGENELPVDIRQSLAGARVAQTFRHIGAPELEGLKSRPEKAKDREVHFGGTIHTLYLVKVGLLNVRSKIQIEVKSGRTDRILVHLPSTVSVVGWNAVGTAKDPEPLKALEGLPEGRTAYEVRYSTPLEGVFDIHVEYQLLEEDMAQLPLPVVQVWGADTQEGSLGITAEPGIEVTPSGSSKDFIRVEVSELPNAITQRTNREILFGYKLQWSGAKGEAATVPEPLSLEIKRHEPVQTLEAVAHQAWYETTLLDDGRQRHLAVFEVANQTAQYLRLALQAESPDVLEVMVAGEDVKAGFDKGKTGAPELAIPLPSPQKTKDFQVVLIYETSGEAYGTFGTLELATPKADMRVNQARWLVRYPKRLGVTIDTELKDESAFLRPDLGEATNRLLQVASEADYGQHAWRAESLRESLSIEVRYVATGPAVPFLLTVLAPLGLALAVWRLARRTPLGGLGIGGLLIGLGAIVVKGLGWQIKTGEGVLVGAVCVVVALTSFGLERRRRKKAEGGAG
jgi:hypothetical protein